jgi:formylglycine-generating enzyme required for sulfatase activity
MRLTALLGRSCQVACLLGASCSLDPSFDVAADPYCGTKAGEVRDGNGLKMKLVWCPPGSFTMGSPKEEDGRNANETHVRTKLTKGFWLGQHEVTRGEWRAVMHTAPWAGEKFVTEGQNYPAACVSWEDATKFCAQLTREEESAGRLPTGWRFALPTEAQWEYACRAGTQTRFFFGDTESQLGEYAWFAKNAQPIGENYPREVARKMPNPWGFYDMNGNVWEMCRDSYDTVLPGGTDPELKVSGWDNSQRVIRGGGAMSPAADCRSAARWTNMSFSRIGGIGFRVAAVPTGAK